MDIQYAKLIYRNNPNILDVGAFNGNHSIMFAKQYPKGKIFSFEADPDVCVIFENNIKLQDISDNIHLVKKAISDTDGTLIFNQALEYVEKKTGSSGTFLKPTLHLSRHPHVSFQPIEVESIRLDTWFESQSIDYIDFMWTDVNGAEISLLRGAQKTLKHTKYLQLECISWPLWEGQPIKNELLELIPDFEIIYEGGEDMLLKNKNIV